MVEISLRERCCFHGQRRMFSVSELEPGCDRGFRRDDET